MSEKGYRYRGAWLRFAPCIHKNEMHCKIYPNGAWIAVIDGRCLRTENEAATKRLINIHVDGGRKKGLEHIDVPKTKAGIKTLAEHKSEIGRAVLISEGLPYGGVGQPGTKEGWKASIASKRGASYPIIILFGALVLLWYFLFAKMRRG